MNCKPGDLAVVVVGAHSAGRIVRCVRLMSLGEALWSKCNRHHGVVNAADQVWLIDGFVRDSTPDGSLAEFSACRDAVLRPIRNPGDDAVDESKAWLPPVPTINPQPVRSKENA